MQNKKKVSRPIEMAIADAGVDCIVVVVVVTTSAALTSLDAKELTSSDSKSSSVAVLTVF